MNEKKFKSLPSPALRMFRAVIFDMDGVVIDSEESHILSEKKAFSKYGIKIKSNELREYSGTTAKYMFSMLIEKYNLDAVPDDILNEKNKWIYDYVKEKAVLFRGFSELVRELKRMKVKTALASSSPKKLVEFVVKNYNLRSVFNAVVSGDDVAKSKPDPEIFLLAARLLGIKPEDCAVIEDAVTGVVSAKSAGMYCIAVTNTFPKEKLKIADLIIRSLEELKDKFHE